ncbi:MAG: NAD(P)H-dependent oxidoreductase subunit E [Lachnospiraceae bacterium]|jgi:NADH:ubiquinone oxidoreductase subunit E|nr:NAD(P)H-dependent oxidoreductase subunit E [Lachnospiraceae bacterium]
MKKKMTTVPFQGTAEQEKQLHALIAEHCGTPGAIMPILQKAQAIYGYLPIEVQQIISDGTGISMSEIYGIVSFYSQFVLNPKGEYAVSVCMGTACYVKGAGAILDRLAAIIKVDPGEVGDDGKFSLDATRCIGACGLAPVFLVNEDVYGRVEKPEAVDGMMKKYME